MAEHFALSNEQAAIWPHRFTANPVRAAVRAASTPTVDEIQAAWLRLAERHEILRTGFEQPVGLRIGVQVVHEPAALPAMALFETRTTAVLEDASWDPEHDPLVRVAITGRALEIAAHPLLLDPPAVAELAQQLTVELAGTPPAVDDPLQYADYVEWQRDLLAADAAAAGRARWESRRHDPSELPFTTGCDGRHDVVAPVALPAPEALAEVGARYGRELDDLLTASLLAFVHRLDATDDVAIDVWMPARHHADLDGALGRFGRYAPTAVDIAPTTTFVELLDRAGRLADQARADVDVLLPQDACGVVAYARVPKGVVATRSPYRLLLTFDGTELTLIGDAAAFAAGAVERFASQLGVLVADAAQRPDAAVAELAVSLARSDSEGMPPSLAADQALFLAAFAAQVAGVPDHTAVTSGTEAISYATLAARAHGVAHALVARGVQPGDVVGVCIERGVDLLVALVGVLESGAAYLPLDAEIPGARLALQLADCDVRIVIASTGRCEALPERSVVVTIDGDLCDARADEGPDIAITPEQRAYVLYTSGSTGTPKGVEVTHGNLANYAHALAAQLGLLDTSAVLRCGSLTSITTDLGNTAIFPALVSGHTVDLVPREVVMDPNRYVTYVAAAPLDMIKVTPSHLHALLDAGASAVLPRRVLVLGGEASPWTLVERIRAAAPGLRVINHYGPTETTIGCCTYELPAILSDADARPATVPIGRPIANTTATVVDAAGRPVGIGVTGELWIGGAGVALGYVGAPEATAAKFVTGADVDRCYRSGDLARQWPDGTLEFLRRADDQVKIRGHRVEPAEIVHALLTHPQVRQAAVVALPDAHGELRLVAYVVTEGNPGVEALRGVVAAALPEAMMPAAFVSLGALPLTASGKLDRRALPAPDASTEGLRRPYVEARTPLETELVAMWCELLGHERIGIEDDFFELGGHSLLGAQVVARIRHRFGVDVPLHLLFTAPTVALLAQQIEALGAVPSDEELDAILAELSDEEIERLLAEE